MPSPLYFNPNEIDQSQLIAGPLDIEAVNPQRGHIPNRPLLPGVLMLEAAAQLAAWMMNKRNPEIGFLGFVGCDDVKFRSQVTPGSRLLLLGKEIKCKPRRFICGVQGVVEDTLVFEAKITGMPI